MVTTAMMAYYRTPVNSQPAQRWVLLVSAALAVCTQKQEIRYRVSMPSDFGRGFKFGMGCVLGAAFILTLFLLGLSMCAGELQRRLLEEFHEQLRDIVPFPPRRDRTDTLHQHGPVGLPVSANSCSEYPCKVE
jgi:hypothetical protein